MSERSYCNKTVIAEHLKNPSNYIVVAGPCSIQSTTTARLISDKLLDIQARMPKECLIVMRAYLDKPRTATGWRGLLYSSPLCASMALHDSARRMPIAIEAVDYAALELLCANGLDDVASLIAIGARTSESQSHRVYASSMRCAVGIKNPVDYNVDALLNGLNAVNTPWEYITDSLEVKKTQGKPALSIGILRGGRGQSAARPLSISSLNSAAARCINYPMLVDVSHDNAKAYSENPAHGQSNAMDALIHALTNASHLKASIKGFMAEMHMEEGKTSDMNQNTKSVTDYCMNPDLLEAMILRWDAAYRA